VSELRDQAAHLSAALVSLLPLALFPCFLTGAWAGLCMGVVREITEEGVISLPALKHCFTGPNSRRDLAFWTLGGLLVGIIA
jgi:hypothetical protein